MIVSADARIVARMRILLLVLGACTTIETADPVDDAPAAPDADEPTTPSPRLSVLATRKLSQLTGDFDRELGVPTLGQTSRAGVWGTDLGASFEHAGRTYLLFGDTVAIDPSRHAECSDAIATTTDTDPSDGLAIDFITDGAEFLSPTVPGVALGCFEVPLDGISIDGTMYVWFSTATMTRSILAKSRDDGATFEFVHDSPFVNVSAVRDGDLLYLFGSNEYRASEVFLATVPVDQIENRDAYEVQHLFGPRCAGELSAHFIGKWIVLYNCDQPRGIQARIADSPTGPWSEQVTVFDPADGYCKFMHEPGCDAVNDPGRELEWGGEYGPYLIESLTEPGDHGAAIHFVLSTWNPYNTMLMRSELAWSL